MIFDDAKAITIDGKEVSIIDVNGVTVWTKQKPIGDEVPLYCDFVWNGTGDAGPGAPFSDSNSRFVFTNTSGTSYSATANKNNYKVNDKIYGVGGTLLSQASPALFFPVYTTGTEAYRDQSHKNTLCFRTDYSTSGSNKLNNPSANYMLFNMQEGEHLIMKPTLSQTKKAENTLNIYRKNNNDYTFMATYNMLNNIDYEIPRDGQYAVAITNLIGLPNNYKVLNYILTFYARRLVG